MPPDRRYRIYNRDMLELLPLLSEDSVDSVVTDPPYHLTASSRGSTPGSVKACNGVFARTKAGGFMGNKWDGGDIAFRPETWGHVLRVLKPGGYMLAFGGSRTFHRIACAVEDAGFEYRDTLMWLYGSGFPKGKGCLKPAFEPLILARKPGPMVLPLQIDGCRIRGEPWKAHHATGLAKTKFFSDGEITVVFKEPHTGGRWPANVLHDGSDEVLGMFAVFGTTNSRSGGNTSKALGRRNDDSWKPVIMPSSGHDDSGTVARFFYCAKAGKKDRDGSKHPTVKPSTLIRYLVRLVTPSDGTVLDPFMGSGTTGKACALEGLRFVGVEKDTDHGYFADARLRVRRAFGCE